MDFLDTLLTEHTPSPDLASYEGIDPRILNISYSSLLDLHSCPRSFQLSKLKATTESRESESSSITFSYGHVVGTGIQDVLERKSWDEIYWRAFLQWKPALFAENPKQNKSFATAIFAIEKFKSLLDQGFLDGYELCHYKGAPACELSFIIHLPGGFKYRGYVDAVLRHSITGEVLVLECKTSSATSVNPATYKNSAQAIGYSIVLDAIFPELSAYDVLYLVYSTKSYQYDPLRFPKSYVQRARWIRELLLDTGAIEAYESSGVYPMHGESCFKFFSECKYMGLCEMDTARLTAALTVPEYEKIQQDHTEFQISITLDDLIHHQIEKTNG